MGVAAPDVAAAGMVLDPVKVLEGPVSHPAPQLCLEGSMAVEEVTAEAKER